MSRPGAADRPLQAWEIAELPLADLLRRAQSVARESCRDSLRVAVLGDGATQYYAGALAAALKCRGSWPEMYEAEFDVIRQEVLDPASGLHRHAPQVVVLFNCVQALEKAFGADGDPATFGRRTAADMAAVWDRLRQASDAVVLQHNLCLPLERPFGNFSLASGVAFAAQVQALNAALAEEVHRRVGIRIVDTESQAAYFGKRQWLDDRLWCQAKQALAPRFLPPLVKAVSDAILLDRGVGVKCLAFDLDDTIWGGTLGEVGLEGLELGESGVGLAFRRVQEAILRLQRRGVLLAVCSKNDEALARRVFREHPDMALREPDIAAFEVHFEPKVDSLRRIAARLNIGLDAIVFLDDSAFERDFVRTALPEVQVPAPPEDPAELPAALARWNLFEAGPQTEEDVQRSALYRTDAARAELRSRFTDVDTYLRDLEMEAEIRPLDAFSLPRVAQLLQRTNQFNLTTRRHGEAALHSFQGDPRAACFSVRLTDRLGDNGIVAAVIGVARGEGLVIDTWVMSCRVFGRCLEHVTLAAIVERARDLGCRRVIGHYAPTAKNKVVADLYPRLGFVAEETRGDVSELALEVASFAPASVPIGVRHPVHEE